MRKIKLYDSRSKLVKELVPLKDELVSMYVCGVTPYDTNHIGHIHVFLVFDILRRLLEASNLQVDYVQNVTDIDDPLFRKAIETGETWQEVRDYWVAYMQNDFKLLNIDAPSKLVYASDEIAQMTRIIRELLKKGYAYQSANNIYFEVAKYKQYGEIVGLDYSGLVKLSAGEYGGNDIKDQSKKDPLDFPLWIGKLGDDLSSDYWPSPWGLGRPGWHIECTAMSTKYLGERIDIHGGGADLLFPHHESEQAQAECFSGMSPFTNFWVHIGMVKYKGKKMSKSKGNLISVAEIIKLGYSPNELKYYLLTNSYRSSWEFKLEDLSRASKAFEAISSSPHKQKTPVRNIDNYLDILANDLDIPAVLEELALEEDLEVRVNVLRFLGFQV